MTTHIAVDMDDVVVDFTNGVDECVWREFGIRLDRTDPWDKKLYEPFGGSEGFWRWMRDRDWLWATFPAVPGAIGTLRKLRDQGFFLEAVTHKPEWAEPQVWRWLGKWRPPFQRVTVVDSHIPKWQVTNAEVLLDDKISTIEDFRRTGRHGILFDPWNRIGADFAVRSWDQFYDLMMQDHYVEHTLREVHA